MRTFLFASAFGLLLSHAGLCKPLKKAKDVNPGLVRLYVNDNINNNAKPEKVRVGDTVHIEGYSHDTIQGSWEIDGVYYKDWDPTVNYSMPEFLQPEDMNKRFVEFYWVSGGQQTARLTGATGGKQFSVHSNVSVEKPIVTLTTHATSVVGGTCPDATEAALPSMDWMTLRATLSAYPTRAQAGITFTSEFADEKYKTDGSKYGFVQIVNMWRRVKATDGTWWYATGRGLDTDSSNWLLPVGEQGETIETNYKTNDSPSQSLAIQRPGQSKEEGVELQATDSFLTWFIYKSPKQGSHWVPLSVVNWRWGGIMIKNSSGTFTVSNPVVPDDPSGESTALYPTWSHTQPAKTVDQSQP